MARLNLKNNFSLCYPILEKNLIAVCSKINETLDAKVPFYELRIDCLLEQGVEIDDIIACINDLIRDYYSKKFIVTIRTKSEGGAIELSQSEYYSYMKELLTRLKVSYIDVEYKYYVLDIDNFNTLIKGSESKIILSKHSFTEKFSSLECEEIIRELIKGKGNIAKLAMKVKTKEDLFNFMNIAKKYEAELIRAHKGAIFIAMGEMGRLSRIYPEYTNTRIVFINAYNNGSILGQYDLGSYLEYRKLLAKHDKN